MASHLIASRSGTSASSLRFTTKSAFLVVQAVNRLKRKEALKPQELAALPPELVVLSEIRDLLTETYRRALAARLVTGATRSSRD